MTRPRVAIVGGGLTGLTAAWHLREDAEVVLHEASAQLGGQIRTIDLPDGPLDVGADAFLARQPAGPELLSALGFGAEDLIHPVAGAVQLWLGDRLRRLPAGTVFGVPTDLRALAASGVLGPADLAFVASEPLRPRRSVPGDRSVADLVGERFGARVVERLVEPLLGGVYAGDARQLSAQATLPPVWAASQEHRSLLRGRVVERLANRLGPRVRTASPVRAVSGGPRGLLLHLDDRTEEADAVVLAVPAAVAARLLAAGWPQVARELAGIRTASVAVVALAYDRGDAASLPPASGVLVPRGEGRLVKAVTLSTNKWPHLAVRRRVVLRASVGRIDDDRARDLADDELRARVDAEVRAALSLTAPAREHAVVRWPDALPQYTIGHHAKLDRIRHLVTQGPAGLHLGGASFDGVGLSARAAEGARLAHDVRWQLRAANARPAAETGS